VEAALDPFPGDFTATTTGKMVGGAAHQFCWRQLAGGVAGIELKIATHFLFSCFLFVFFLFVFFFIVNGGFYPLQPPLRVFPVPLIRVEAH
jgi:hypothetical protein